MGSSQRKKKTRQPTRLAPVGSGGGQFDDDLQNSPEDLLIPLTRIRLAVLRQSAEGDPVEVLDHTAGLLVKAPSGLIGQVPPHYEAVVRRSKRTRGVIAERDLEPPAAKIALGPNG